MWKTFHSNWMAHTAESDNISGLVEAQSLHIAS